MCVVVCEHVNVYNYMDIYKKTHVLLAYEYKYIYIYIYTFFLKYTVITKSVYSIYTHTHTHTHTQTHTHIYIYIYTHTFYFDFFLSPSTESALWWHSHNHFQKGKLPWDFLFPASLIAKLFHTWGNIFV